MHILITGGAGMLGSSVGKIFTNHDLLLTDSHELDVRNIKQVMSYTDKKLDLILHLAAETDLSKAEFNPGDAYTTNLTGTQNMLELAKKLNIPIVYISTAMIFDGKKKSYSEEDKGSPTNHYGRSKYYGELAVKSYEKHYIVRSGWAFGGGPKIDRKFISKIYKQIQVGAKKLYGIRDIYGNPTYTMDFARTLKNIVEAKIPYGTYNSPGKGTASRYEVLAAFVDYLGLSNKLEIIPVTLNKYLTLFPSSFPYIKNEVLSLTKMKQTDLSAMRDWREALQEYTKEFKIEQQ
jgi:dTDP-4-dehydrorhamnose reductase